MEDCYYCDGEHAEGNCPVRSGDVPLREWKCDCGRVVQLYYWERASDTSCDCGQMFNCWGQRVNGSLYDIDPMDVGEGWDDD